MGAAAEHKAAGNAAFAAGDYASASEHFTRAIAEDPTDHLFYSNRSACGLALGKLDEAKADAAKCVELKPDWAKGYSRLGQALLRAGDLDGAQKAYMQGLGVDPDSEALMDGLAEVRKAKKNGGKVPTEEMAKATVIEDVIGIDLGTTYSAVAVFRNGEVEVLVNDQGERTTASWVAFNQHTGERLVGDAAKRQAAMNTQNTFFNIKRIIGKGFEESRDEIKLMPFDVSQDAASGKPLIKAVIEGKEREYFPEQLSAMVLEEMKDIAEKALGHPVTKAVVTVPAYFNDAQRRLTKDAGRIAGLDVLRIINEPTAAALAYGLGGHATSDANTLDDLKTILVFDLGGGTFDVSVLEIDQGVFGVLSTAGDTHLGGEDFDSAIADFAIGEFKKKQKGTDHFTGNARNMRKLRTACERAKRALSAQNQATIELTVGDEDLQMELTRAKMDKLCDEPIKRTLEAVKRALQDSKKSKEDIDEIVLVGGSTRIVRIQTMLQEFFNGKELCKSVNPDEAVAYGAAVQAAILSGAAKLSKDTANLLLVDVIPLSLGIETEGRRMAVVVPRNTSIPTTRTESFTTVEDYQTSVDVRVFEGERQSTDGNNLLGQFTIRGIQRAKRGEAKVDVTFDLNSNGLLTVTAEDPITKAKANVEIDHDRGRLSEEDVNKMLEDAKRYKAEDEARYRAYLEAQGREVEE